MRWEWQDKHCVAVVDVVVVVGGERYCAVVTLHDGIHVSAEEGIVWSIGSCW